MRTLAVASIVLAALGTSNANPLLKDRAACNADNCARLVTGTRAGLPMTRLADCSSFQKVYVIPTPVTSTRVYHTTTTVIVTESLTTVDEVSITITETQGTVSVVRPTSSPADTAGPARIAAAVAATNTASEPITLSQTAVPTYAASVCSPASRYESACSCAGVTRTTSTLVPITSFVFSTSIATTTSTTYAVATEQSTATFYTWTSVATATATGLPCGSVVNPHVGYDDSYLVRCNNDAMRFNYHFGSTNASTEYQCLLDCANNGLCSFASYVFNTQLCDLYQGDSANIGNISYTGQDILQRVIRGTGTGSGYAGPTGTIAARRLDKYM